MHLDALKSSKVAYNNKDSIINKKLKRVIKYYYI